MESVCKRNIIVVPVVRACHLQRSVGTRCTSKHARPFNQNYYVPVLSAVDGECALTFSFPPLTTWREQFNKIKNKSLWAIQRWNIYGNIWETALHLQWACFLTGFDWCLASCCPTKMDDPWILLGDIRVDPEFLILVSGWFKPHHFRWICFSQ